MVLLRESCRDDGKFRKLTLDNNEDLLRTGMAGRAKISGEEMPVWKAFTLGIVRFFQVQVWSWVP